MAVRRAVVRSLLGLSFVAAIGAGLPRPLPALAESPFAGLNGSWTGSGQIRLASGNTEALKCKAYYTPKESGVGLAIRCASASNRIELRAVLTFQGGRVSGSWEERTFNAAGDLSGQASGNRINLSITGGGFTGTMSVATTGSSQTVSITTDGIGLRGVNINLSRG
jgi:hypothetical protein